MACSKRLQDAVGDVTECPICTETMIDPRVLPCIHTFCFKCLDQLWIDKQPGVKAPCPLCRTEVVIPVEGVSGLPKNFFVEKLVEAQKMSETENKPVICDICSIDEEAGNAESISERFCFDCRQNLCNKCFKVHSSMKGTKTHQVISKGNRSSETMELIRFPEPHCASHEEQKIQIYCMECKVALCTICFITKHNRHECSDIKTIAEDLKKRIKSNVENTRRILAGVDNQSKALEELLVNFDLNVKETKSTIVQTGEQMKQLIDKHVQDLLQELDGERMRKIKEFEAVKEELLVQKLSLESFIKYSEKILEKAVPADVASVAEDLSVRFESLKIEKGEQIEKSLGISFIPCDSQFSLSVDENDENVIGRIKVYESIIFSTYDDPKLLTSVPFSGCVRGIAASSQQFFVIIDKSNKIQVFNSKTFAKEPSIPVLGLSDPYDIAGSENILHIGSICGDIYRIELRDKSITSWSVGRGNGAISLSVNKHGHVIATSDVSNKLYEYTSTGELRREILLKCSLLNPYRAVHMDGDQFLVSQFGGKKHWQRVCLIDNQGNLIKSFGNTQGSGNANLSKPYRLVVDRNGSILVADHLNRRVVLLNKQLEYVKDIIPTSMNMSTIFTLFLDEGIGRLYLSNDCNNQLAIFNFEAQV